MAGACMKQLVPALLAVLTMFCLSLTVAVFAADGAEPSQQAAAESSGAASPDGDGRVAEGAEYWLYAAISLLSAVCLLYLIYVLYKERKKHES